MSPASTTVDGGRLAFPDARALDLVAIGECMVELWEDEALAPGTLRRAYGGDGLNALITAARLGARAGFVTLVGDDPFGADLVAQWHDEGVDVTHCRLVPGYNGLYFITVGAGGERHFSYRRDGSAASTLTPEHLDADYVGGSRALLLSGVTQAISATAQAATLAAARIARERGTIVAYDPNYRPSLWAKRAGEAPDARVTGPELARSAFQELLPLADLLLPSAPADAVLWRAEALAPRRVAEDAIAAGAMAVGLKVGADGAWVGLGGEVVHLPAPAVERVIDTTGAGDAWNAGFLLALMDGATAAEAAAFAHRVAAATLPHRGAVPPREAVTAVSRA